MIRFVPSGIILASGHYYNNNYFEDSYGLQCSKCKL